MSALDFHRHFQAYRHNGDDRLLEKLGLKTDGYVEDGAPDNWIHLGTVVVEVQREEMVGKPKKPVTYPAATVRVEVSCKPAQFWRFTVRRYRSKITGDVAGGGDWGVELTPQTFRISTGSGGFSDYWEAAALVARNMIDVEVVTDVAGD